MKRFMLGIMIAASALATACGGANATSTPTSEPTGTKNTSSSAGASAIVKSVYDAAIRRDCSAIPPMLTDDFRKAIGTSKDSLDALCDSITDSGKVIAATVIGENINGDVGTIRVKQTLKDGASLDKEERVKRTGGKWLMDS